jgi:stage V sporulation protein B
VTLRAAIPAFGALAGETFGLFLMLILCVHPLLFIKGEGSHRTVLREILSLALPLTGMRVVGSLMRTVNATLIPARLTLSGLPQGEALSQLGIMNGMLMPMLMLPSFITCSLCMVSAPELTRRQAQGRPLRPLCIRIAGAALGVGFVCMTGVSLSAPLIADKLYRQAELLPLLRRCCPLIPLMALTQVLGGMMNGLGLQNHALRISLLSGFVSVLTTYILAALPALRLWGVIIAMAFSQVITLCLSAAAIKQTISLHSGCTSR